MMKKIICSSLSLMLALLMLAGLLVSCANKESDAPEGMQNANCDGDIFRLYIPENWTSTSKIGISGGYALSTLRTNVSVKEYKAGEGETVDSFLADLVEDCKTVYTEVTLIETTSGALGGENAKTEIYTLTNGEEKLKMMLTLTQHKGLFYLFTYIADVTFYDSYLKQVQMITEKFSFEDVPLTKNDADKDYELGVKTPVGMKLASDKDLAYRFFAPESWQVSADEITSVIFESDRSNVSVTEYIPDADFMSIDQYWEMCEKSYSSQMNELTVITAKAERKIGKRTAFVYEFSAKVDGEVYKFMQAMMVKGSKIYIITYTAADKFYDLHKTEAEQMIDNFSFR